MQEEFARKYAQIEEPEGIPVPQPQPIPGPVMDWGEVVLYGAAIVAVAVVGVLLVMYAPVAVPTLAPLLG